MALIIAGTVLGGRLASLNLLDLIWQATWLVQFVILLLVTASILSWAAIIFKWRELSGAQQDSEGFLEAYREGSLDGAYEAARQHDESPMAAIFVAAYAELKRIARYSGSTLGAGLDESQHRGVARHVSWVAAQESSRLEARLSLLATVGSASPFVGLFGTVVGIINAFTGIGASGSASLAVVAPGIAEALIATAVGLVAAIPATIFYNLLLARIRDLDAGIHLFSEELLGDLKRPVQPAAASARAAEA